MADIPQPQEVTPQDPVQKHLQPPVEPDWYKKASQAKDDAIERYKQTAAQSERMLEQAERQNELLSQALTKANENMAAVQDMVATSSREEPAAGRRGGAPQPGTAQEVDLNALTGKVAEAVESRMAQRFEPFVQKVAQLGTREDRRAFEGELSQKYGQPVILTQQQAEGIERAMREHPTLDYRMASRHLPDELAIVAPAQTEQHRVAAPQPGQPPQPGFVASPPVMPQLAVPVAGAPPGARLPEPTKEPTPKEMMLAAQNAERAGASEDKDAILMERIRQGTKDEFQQFGGHFPRDPRADNAK